MSQSDAEQLHCINSRITRFPSSRVSPTQNQIQKANLQWRLVCSSIPRPSGPLSFQIPSPNSPLPRLVGSGAPQPHHPSATPSLCSQAMASAPRLYPSLRMFSPSPPLSKVPSSLSRFSFCKFSPFCLVAEKMKEKKMNEYFKTFVISHLQ